MIGKAVPVPVKISLAFKPRLPDFEIVHREEDRVPASFFFEVLKTAVAVPEMTFA